MANPILRGGTQTFVPTSFADSSHDEAAFESLRTEVEGPKGSSAERLLELANLADEIGTRSIHNDPISALSWFRDSAAYAMFSLSSPGINDPASRVQATAIALHNHAVEELLRCSGTGPSRSNPAWREQLAAVGVEVTSTKPDRTTIPYDQLWIASDFRVRNLKEVRRDGLGVPLITLSLFPNREALPDHFLPQKLRLPATGTIRPAGLLQGGEWRAKPVTLALHDPAREETISPGAGSRDIPLAADLTTPFAHQMIQSPFRELSWGGLLRPDAYNSSLGIFMEAPYQSGKIPVLFIHGLWSSPDVWLVMSNKLHADPVLRDHYQFWYAYYPTGAPVMSSAIRLRQSLHDLREYIDPQHGDAALDQMVVVGHSLGGVLSRQLLLSSGGALEKALFTRPFDQVAMSPDSRMVLTKFMYFEPVPSVRRAVFIAAPHRGSNTANQLIGRFGSALVRRSSKLAEVHSEVIALNGPDVLQPFYRRRPPSSIDNLTWESPSLKALSDLRIASGVPYHSIVANLFPNAPPRFWTDGLVSYDSAHLEGADSEIMVKHNHFANGTEEATGELHRILRLHIGLTERVDLVSAETTGMTGP